MWSSFGKVSRVPSTRKFFKLTRLEITFLFAENCSWCLELPTAHPNTHLLWDHSPDMNYTLCPPLAQQGPGSTQHGATNTDPSRHKSSTPSVPHANTCHRFTESRLWREEAHSWFQWHKQALHSITRKIFKAFFTRFIQTKPVQAQDHCL